MEAFDRQLFGKRLRNLRIQKNVSQKDLAAILLLSNSTVSQYESGTRIPDMQMLIKIADYFRCPTDYLLGRTDDPNMEKNLAVAHYKGLKGDDLSGLDDIIEDAIIRAAKWREDIEKREK